MNYQVPEKAQNSSYISGVVVIVRQYVPRVRCLLLIVKAFNQGH